MRGYPIRSAATATILLLSAAAIAPAAAPPGPADAGGRPPSAPAAVRLAYRFTEGAVLKQTSRQVQKITCEADPSLGSESTLVGRVEAKVVQVDAHGTALVDEVTSYEATPGQVDHRRLRMTRLGDVVKSEVIEGDPSTLQGGAIFVDRSVRPGETWPTRVKGLGGGPAYFIPLEVTLREIRGRGADALAFLDLKGKMDMDAVTAMLGKNAILGGIAGTECRVSGEVVFRIQAGREKSSKLGLQCSLEITRTSRPTVPATLSLIYDTETEDPAINSMPSP